VRAEEFIEKSLLPHEEQAEKPDGARDVVMVDSISMRQCRAHGHRCMGKPESVGPAPFHIELFPTIQRGPIWPGEQNIERECIPVDFPLRLIDL